MQLVVPFAAAAAGKPLQIGLMRSDEISKGVTVFDEDGEPRGFSRIAGMASIGMTLAVRIVYLVPMLYLPLVQDAVVRRYSIIKTRPYAQALFFVGMTALSSAFVTPVCMALFDQWSSLPVGMLEPDLQGLVRQNDRGVVKTLFFNKGL